MNEERLYKVIIGPCISEKAESVLQENNQYAFKVLPSATKLEIKQAVKFIFKVEVKSVRMLNVKGKSKRTYRGVSCKPSWKKAYIGLEAGDEIDIGEYR